ncbi:MAG: flagellar hook-associated protein FlgK [Terracidiphilus sp.]
MGTISSAFGIISGALDAEQSGLSIVAGNVANANTPGYTEEQANWVENTPVTINGITYGTGVTETGATSVRDRVLEQRLDQQQQLASASTSRLAALDTMQTLFPPDSGSSSSTAGDIGSDVTSFFDSFSSLEANPSDDSLRQQVLSTAATLAGDISNAASSLEQQGSALDQEAAGVVTQVNALTTSLAQLNKQIQSSSPNADAGTLEDQRQEDLSQLSQLIGINQITTENNGLTITTTSGQTLVSEGTSTPITTGVVDGATHFFVGGTDITTQLESGGGSLGGYLTAGDQDIPAALGALDQLAYGISTQVNLQNAAGTDLNGDPGRDIFSQPTQTAGSALQMSVVMTDPSGIAAAAGAGADSGDDSNAIALSNLGNQATIRSATSNFSVTQNLNSGDPSATGSIELYDSKGNSYTATITYTNEGGNTWEYSISLPETLQADTSVPGQVSYTLGAGATVDPSTNLTITGATALGGTASIAAPAVTPGEPLGSAGPPPTGYVGALDAALATAGITGVTVSSDNGVLTISGASSTSGSVVADAASTNATGTLQFNAGGALVTPAGNIGGITFSGLSDGAAPLNLTWDLYGGDGAANIAQSAAASAQTAQSQDGYATGDSPEEFYSSFVSTLGSTVNEVETENTAQNASVAQLQTQNNALSEVNLNDEASSMTTLERSYQAASQVFSMLNTIMASALNLGEQTTVS